jgi:methylmalonyl-CoA mutase
MRSMATRQANIAMSEAVDESVKVFRAAGFDLIIVETAGIGQSDSEITEVADVSLYVMTPEYGAATQLEKIDMIDYADLIAINKFDKRGALDALRDVKKQYQRTRNLWHAKADEMPVFGTIASQFNDPGTNQLYRQIMAVLAEKTKAPLASSFAASDEMSEKIYIIPPDRTRYLAEISEENDRFEKWVKEQAQWGTTLYNVEGTIAHLKTLDASHAAGIETLSGLRDDARRRLAAESQDILNGWEAKNQQYKGEFFSYEVRGKVIKVANFTESLSHTKVPKIALPRFRDYGEILRWSFRENVPGEFPYTAGVYPFKRTGEDPTRMFAGEGGPERTNKRFHYVSQGLPAARLSTAFDSVTLYGEDPDYRPDIYGKIGNSGVSIACLDDAKRLYSGFDLCKPTTSVSMTINGPAPMLLAFYMNTAVDQQCEKYIRANGLVEEVDQKIRQHYADRNVGLTAHKGASVITQIEAIAEGFRVHYKSGTSVYNWGLPALGYLRFWVDSPEKVVVIPRYRAANPEAYLAGLMAIGQSMVDHMANQSITIGEGWWEFDSCEVVEVEDNLFDIRYRFTPEAGVRAGERFLWHVAEQQYFSSISAYQALPPAPSVLPEGNDGLGLMLLGVTGDQVLPAEVYAEIKTQAMSTTRGTVQADILKEDQAQNTCIFSTEFALRMMGDIQQYFIDHAVRNFYSVSISGYHIAEAGVNPISQLAFTLANGFTFVEYYLSRGMHIDDFAPNLSFFFSNGMDPEYAVIGRVARRIWAKAIKNKYGGNERSQMLKYHIQTSGRSLHAQEIAFNDIRTTLQALYAIYDNCNSLHTNAYDEAITTPTEESVRRAMAIQLIINKELGEAKNENPLQGSFIIEDLTDLVEEAVMTEFKRITDRGGVLGAMETMYQRSKIQEESLYYEMQKHTGELPIIGVNTFLSSEGSPTIIPKEVIRSTAEEKEAQIKDIQSLQVRNAEACKAALRALQLAAIKNENLFDALMQAGKVCSLGQMTHALYEVGGQYRRNM